MQSGVVFHRRVIGWLVDTIKQWVAAMKQFLLVALPVFGCAAYAQTAPAVVDQPASLDDKEAMTRWEKLTILAAGDSEEEAASHLRSHGMSEDGARTLWALRTKGLAEFQQIGRQFYASICNRQAEIRETGGPEMVAQMVEQTSQRETDTRRRLLAEADDLLSLQDHERLEHLYSSDHGPKGGITETNIASRVRSGEIPVESAIATACGQLSKEK